MNDRLNEKLSDKLNMTDYRSQVSNTAELPNFGRVAVLYGGVSAERDVSLKSGRAVAAGLREKSIDVVELDIGEHPVAQLLQAKCDRAFIALHGAGGEDGKMQALLDLMGIPYTGSRHQASAIAMDKLKTKQIWSSVGLPTPKHALLTESADWGSVLQSLHGEAFVKPIHEGSSIGMRFVVTASELKSAFDEAKHYDRAVLAEAKVTGAEYTVAILNGQALPPIKLETDHVFYDYDAKYVSNTTRYLCPCGLSEEKSMELKTLALAAFNAIGCSAWGRVDIMQNRNGEFYLLEVNTVPGMTDHSLVPMAAKEAGLTFSDLVTEILLQTI